MIYINSFFLKYFLIDNLPKLWHYLKDRPIIKVFEPFEDLSKPSTSFDVMMISYGCVYKLSSKQVMKGSRVETIEVAKKEYKQLLD